VLSKSYNDTSVAACASVWTVVLSEFDYLITKHCWSYNKKCTKIHNLVGKNQKFSGEGHRHLSQLEGNTPPTSFPINVTHSEIHSDATVNNSWFLKLIIIRNSCTFRSENLSCIIKQLRLVVVCWLLSFTNYLRRGNSKATGHRHLVAANSCSIIPAQKQLSDFVLFHRSCQCRHTRHYMAQTV